MKYKFFFLKKENQDTDFYLSYSIGAIDEIMKDMLFFFYSILIFELYKYIIITYNTLENILFYYINWYFSILYIFL